MRRKSKETRYSLGLAVLAFGVAALPLWAGGTAQAFTAVRPGISRVQFPGGGAAFARIARKQYEGRARFRFLADPDHDD